MQRKGAHPSSHGLRRPHPQPVSTARLFYALWPDAATRDALAALQFPAQGRKVPPANLHLTLAFLGSQPRDSLPLLEAQMERLPASRYLLRIDSYGYFHKPRIAWAGPSSVPDPLLWQYNALMNALDACHVSTRHADNFRPHVTLARDADRIDSVIATPVEWPVTKVALVESVAIDGGVRYEPLALRTLS